MIQKPKRLLIFVMFFYIKLPKELLFITLGMEVGHQAYLVVKLMG
jgi:hypothetical protein